jgi:hypothetical protein
MAVTRFSRPRPPISPKQNWLICALTDQGHFGCFTRSYSAIRSHAGSECHRAAPRAPEWRHLAPLAEPTVAGPRLLTPGGVRMREMAG